MEKFPQESQESASQKESLKMIYEERKKEALKMINSAIVEWKKRNIPEGEEFDRQTIGKLVSDLSSEARQHIDAITAEFENEDIYSLESVPAVKLLEGKDGQWPDIWLLGWRSGETEADYTSIHDHEDSEAAFTVHQGVISEQIYAFDQDTKLGADEIHFNIAQRDLLQGSTATIGAPYIHKVLGKVDHELSVTIHAYYPPLDAMNLYEETAPGLLKKVDHWSETRDQDCHCGSEAATIEK